jgi:hypothetical protein
METNISITRLRELHGSGYEIEDGQPNIIGWDIRDADNRKFGVVDDLLFDPELHKVRYIIANLKNNDFDLERRKVLIPIGIAELAESDDNVIIPVSVWQIRALPAYSNRLTDDDEQDIYVIFSNAPALSSTGTGRRYQPKAQNFYENQTYNYDNLFKRRTKNIKDKPSFRYRKGVVEPTIRDNDAEYDLRRKEIRDPEAVEDAMAVKDTKSSYTEEDKRRRHEENVREQREESNDRLLTKIKRMQDELNEIERDFRNTRMEGRI